MKKTQIKEEKQKETSPLSLILIVKTLFWKSTKTITIFQC